MYIKTGKIHIIRSVCALVLAGLMILGSVFTVAAAVQSAISTESEERDISGDRIVKTDPTLELLNKGGNYHVLTAFEVTVNCGNETTKVISNGETIADVLKTANIVVGADQVTVPAQSTKITSDMNVTVYNGKEISVTADGKTSAVLLPPINIVKALNAAGFGVTDDDILSVSRNSNASDVSNVTIERVTFADKTSTEPIAYESVKENSDDIELGETKLKTEGKDGEMLVATRYKYIDGKEIDKEVVDKKVITEPIDEVTLVGTKGAATTTDAAGTFTDSNGAKVAYTRVLNGSGTAYTAPAGASTATGVAAYHGGVAVNPNIIPYGSKLYIEAADGSCVYGYATAVDTGGALMAGTALVDCFYNTYDECISFGRRNVNVYVIA